MSSGDPVARIRLANSLTDILSVCKINDVLTISGKGEIGDATTSSRSFDIRSCRTDDLAPAEREEIFAMFESSLKEQYAQNWGWNPTEKRKELFHPMSRFLCLYERDVDTNIEGNGSSEAIDHPNSAAITKVTESTVETVFQTAASTATPLTATAETKKNLKMRRPCIGYTTFRFEWDDEDEPEYPVLYCYELQVSHEMQGLGIGRNLMSILTKISDKLHMWKVLLTCFVSNKKALQFYKSIGFDSDINSPIAMGDTTCSYEILSNKPYLR